MTRLALALASNLALVGVVVLAVAVPQRSTESSWRPSWRPATPAEEQQHQVDRMKQMREPQGVPVTVP